MTALFDEFPDLKTEERRELLTDLTSTLNAKSPEADSVEALLLDWAGRPTESGYFGLFRDGYMDEKDSPARRILLRGFDAVPGLLALLGDRRVTVHERPAFMNAEAHVRRVGELAEYLLCEIAGDGAPSLPDGPDPKAWKAWWEMARQGKEQEYFAASVFSKNGKSITRVHEMVARIIAHKWPELLPGLCEQYSKSGDPDTAPFGLAEALAASRLPKAERINVLAKFAQRGSLAHRRWVLQVLANLDADRCAKILGPLLDKIPKDAEGEYWKCPDAYFTQVVVKLDDAAIWREYLRVVKRSSVGLRLEMLSQLNYKHLGTKTRLRRIAFLAAFLNDQTIRDASQNPQKFSGPFAAFNFQKISVRDFAAMQIASMLDINADPDCDWNEIEWAKLRNAVRRRLADETLPDLGP